MRNVLLALVLACVPVVVLAAGWPAVNSDIAAGRSAIGVVGSVADNATLALASTVDHPSGVWRLDYATGRNAGALLFQPQTGTCSANNMVNDGGRCADALAGNSFRAVHPAAGSSPKQWGAVGDAVTDDTAAVQAAFTAAGNWRITLRIGARDKFGISATGLTCSLPMQMIGNAASPGPGNAGDTQSGFTALVANTTLLKLLYGCSGSLFANLHFAMGNTIGGNTSGAAITMGDGTVNGSIPGGITFQGVSIVYPCIGIDVNGNTIRLDDVTISNLSGTGCGGIRVGHNTTNATTVGTRISDAVIGSDPTAPAEYGMLFEDAGSPFVTNSDNIYTGTIMRPGNGQAVKWGFFSNTVLGDQVKTATGSLLITTDTGAVANEHHVFDNVWGVVSPTSAAPANVTFSAPVAASFGWFTIGGGSRFFGGQQDTIRVNAGHDIHIRGNTLCGFGNPSGYGVYTAALVNRVIIQGNYLRSSCGATPAGTPTASIALGASGGNDDYLVTGNTLDPATGISYTPNATSIAFIKDNPGSSFNFTGAIVADTCQGLGTGTCAFDPGSSLESWVLTLSPAGTPLTIGNNFLTQPGAAAKNSWRCTATLKNGSVSWIATASVRDLSGPSQPIVQWATGGAALTAGQTYKLAGSCSRM
jgi:hypothetical protein